MNKYAVVWTFNLLFGIGQIILGAGIILTVSRIQGLFADFNVTQPSKIPAYFAISICVVLGLYNCFLASKFLPKSDQQAGYFKTRFISILMSLATLGLLVASTVFSTILPIYTLTSQFWKTLLYNSGEPP